MFECTVIMVIAILVVVMAAVTAMVEVMAMVADAEADSVLALR